MNRIEKKFTETKESKRKILSVFLTAGYPSLSATERLVLELEKCGVDLFEIGFPFSDPIADGPTIQKSSEIALKNGVTWKKALCLCKSIRKKSNVPLVLMSYANPLFCRGWENSARELAQAGFDGAIIPDLIPEESSGIRSAFKGNGLRLIYLISPTSSQKRIEMVTRESTGFIYCVSVTGVTGARKNLPMDELFSFLRRVKKISRRPILLGFGISKAEQIGICRGSVDGFVIGSALIKKLDGIMNLSQLIRSAKDFITPFVRCCK